MDRNVLLLILALAQLAAPPLLFAQGFAEGQARPPLDIMINPATPAGYAFAIWGPIFLGCVGLGIYGVSRKGRGDPVIARIALPCSIGFALCIGWLVAARFGPLWLTVPIILGMALSIGTALWIALERGFRGGWARRVAVNLPLGLYAGWLTAATFVNAADVLPGYGVWPADIAPVVLGVSVIACAGLAASGFVAARKAHPAYVAAVLWALIAILMRNRVSGLEDPVVIAAAAAATLFALLVAALWLRRFRGESLPDPLHS